MKHLFLLLAIGLTACGHEMTKMDRELALKLADRQPVVIAAAPAPVINIYNGQTTTSPQSAIDDRKTCNQSPVYDIQGHQTGVEKHCFGGD